MTATYDVTIRRRVVAKRPNRTWHAVLSPEMEFPIEIAEATLIEPETLIYPATEDGNVASWEALSGSFQGAIDVEHALLHGGWELVTKEDLEAQREKD